MNETLTPPPQNEDNEKDNETIRQPGAAERLKAFGGRALDKLSAITGKKPGTHRSGEEHWVGERREKDTKPTDKLDEKVDALEQKYFGGKFSSRPPAEGGSTTIYQPPGESESSVSNESDESKQEGGYQGKRRSGKVSD